MVIQFVDLEIVPGQHRIHSSSNTIPDMIVSDYPGAVLLRWAITAATPDLWHIEAVITHTPVS